MKTKEDFINEVISKGWFFKDEKKYQLKLNLHGFSKTIVVSKAQFHNALEGCKLHVPISPFARISSIEYTDAYPEESTIDYRGISFRYDKMLNDTTIQMRAI